VADSDSTYDAERRAIQAIQEGLTLPSATAFGQAMSAGVKRLISDVCRSEIQTLQASMDDVHRLMGIYGGLGAPDLNGLLARVAIM
jgi:hypothetical protein